MAANGKKSYFNEATRVQMPALVHLTRIGYTYFGKITEGMAGTIYDPDTNILISIFKEQFAKLNPDRSGEAEAMLRTIRQEPEYDALGGIVPIQGVFYCTGSKKTSPFNCIKTLMQRLKKEFYPISTIR